MFAKLSPTTLGVLLAVGAYAVYTWADAIIKGVGGGVGIFEIGFFTTIFSVLPALFWRDPGERWRDAFRLRRPWLTNFVAVMRVGASIFITYSFVSIPFAEAYSIVFLIPVFVTVLATIVLKERVDALRWALVIISFLGVVIVVRPGFRELELGHLAALGCAICAAAATTTMRLISGEERRVSLFLVPSLFILVANAILMVPTFVMPDWGELLALVACGALGGLGYLMQISAIRHAPASRVAPMQYSQIVWALILGALFFDEFPDTVASFGLIVVVLAGVAGILTDGTRARIASRFAEFRAKKPVASKEEPPIEAPSDI